MNRTTIDLGTFNANCSILSEGARALLVDPGADAPRLAALLAHEGLEPLAILLTHAHFDHIGAVAGLQRAFSRLPVFVGRDDVPLLSHPLTQFPPDYPPVEAITNVKDAAEAGSCLAALGWRTRIETIDTPGHTPGGVCYLFSTPGEAPLLLSGDPLFCGSIGRTDFPGGSLPTLRASLAKLTALPGETVVVPGHGCETTIARERATNPFLV